MSVAQAMDSPSQLKAYGRTATLPRSGRALFYYEAGPPSLPALLLVHGLGDEADSFRHVIEPLATRFRVIAPDLPGFGRSPLPKRGRLDPPALRDTLIELLESLGVERATILGSSLGATLAQLVALERPDLAERLVLVDGALAARARFRGGMLLMLLPGVGRRRYRRLGLNLDAAYESLRPYYAALDRLPAEDRAFLRRRVAERVLSPTQGRAYLAVLRGLIGWMVGGGRAAARKAARLGLPSLYVWGGEDRIITLSVGEAASRQQPGARLEIIPGAGHLPHQECPSEFIRVLTQFLESSSSEVTRWTAR